MDADFGRADPRSSTELGVGLAIGLLVAIVVCVIVTWRLIGDVQALFVALAGIVLYPGLAGILASHSGRGMRLEPLRRCSQRFCSLPTYCS
jgi:Mg/Co/Ni transporter MgtE